MKITYDLINEFINNSCKLENCQKLEREWKTYNFDNQYIIDKATGHGPFIEIWIDTYNDEGETLESFFMIDSNDKIEIFNIEKFINFLSYL
jgi:hypothetical protein